MNDKDNKVDRGARPYKICVVSPMLPPAFGGGGDLFYRYAVRLQEQGQLAFVLTHQHQEQSYQNFQSRLSEHNILRVPLEVPEKALANYWVRNVSRAWCRCLLFFRVGWTLVTRRLEYDVVVVMGGEWLSTMAVLWARLAGRTTVYEPSLAGYDDPIAMKEKRWRLQYEVLTRADVFVAQSPLLYDLCRDGGVPSERLYLIGNSVDTDLFCPVDEPTKTGLRKKLDLPTEAKIITFVGAMIERKGADLVPAIFHAVLREIPSACLVLVGPQNTAANITELIQEELRECLSKRQVVFTGAVGNLQEYYQASDIFLFPSRMEGFGTVLVEAMACGLPCVAHGIEGITSSIIADGIDGFIIQNEDTAEYTKTIVRLLCDAGECRATSIRAREKVLSRFSAAIIDQQYRRIYEKHLG